MHCIASNCTFNQFPFITFSNGGARGQKNSSFCHYGLKKDSSFMTEKLSVPSDSTFTMTLII